MEEDVPLAYLISFRAYGTWLHGDQRGSVDRHHNRFGTPRIAPNEPWRKYNQGLLRQAPVKLSSRQRASIEEAIRETCKIRGWELWTTNIRTNHVHTVVAAGCKPEKILAAFKANATRKLREAGLWRSGRSPWVLRGSKRYLWTERDVINAVVYVEYDQGEPLP
jgi:REP element-mobilizing transposase RayT